ncbi:MAG: endonuclease [Erysipelotrichales bacterium]|nr:endonuclease [Erysipelotrichales bacterium]
MKKNIIKSFVLISMLSICALLNINFNNAYVLAENVDARLEYYNLNGVNSEYLDDINGAFGIDLQNGLSILMSATQTKITSYDELKRETINTDADPMNSNNIITLYARDSISGVWDSSLWNREHVWCKSLSNGLYTSVAESHRNAGTDIHHLRPAYVTYNSSRQDRPYGIVDKNSADTKELGNTGNFAMPGIFEPRDDIKGDVARILMYVYTRYSSNLSSTNGELGQRGELRITDIVKTSSNSEVDAWDLLIKWNEDDPVDYLEMHRNDEAQKLQGNRNVFIDHPEFAKMCFGSYQGEGALVDLNNTYDENKISYLGINNRNLTLIAGRSESFIAKTFPENIAAPTIKWKSFDNSIVTINSSGKAVAINEGNTVIEAYVVDSVGAADTSSKKVDNVLLSVKCNVEVVNSKLIYRYDGNALSTTSTYNSNIKSEFTSNNITMEVMASYGSANNGNLWLGTNNNQNHMDKSKIAKDSPIGVALTPKISADRKGAVLYFNGELDNVGKVTFQQLGGQSGTYIYLLYSIDFGDTYQQIGERLNIGGSTEMITFNFDTIERARYAIALTTADDSRYYVQSKKPSVTFYSEEVTGDELVDDLLNNFDVNDLDNSIYQATLITNANDKYITLTESEKNNISKNNIAKLESLSNEQLQGYSFIYCYWSKTINELSQAEIDEIVEAFNNLPEDGKAFVSKMKNVTMEYDDIITIGDAIKQFDKDDNNDTQQDPDIPSNNYLWAIVGVGIGVIIIAIALIFILKRKH